MFLPALPGGARIAPARRLRLLGAPAVLPPASFVTYTYVAPIAREIAGAGGEGVALLIACAGTPGHSAPSSEAARPTAGARGAPSC